MRLGDSGRKNMINPKLVHEYLTLSAQLYPDKEALICGEERLTYEAIDRASNNLSNTLINMGLSKQDRVIIFLDNSVETVISLYGVLKAGGTFVILNVGLKAKKLNYILKDSGAAIMITHVSKAKTVVNATAADEELRIIWVGEPSGIPEMPSSYSHSWDSAFEDSCLIKEKLQSREPKENSRECIDCDLATLVYTSGSTGEPKGVMSSHYNMISAARSIIKYLGNTSDEIILNVLPLSFDYGLYQVIMSFMFGGTVVLEKSFAYPIKIIECLEREKVTGFPVVPTMIVLMLKMKHFKKKSLKSLRYITNTAAAMPEEHIYRITSLLPHVKMFSMYGLTECKRVSYLEPEELTNRPLSVGKAMPDCEVFIVNNNGDEAAVNEVGELVIKGPNVMHGYWNDAELTEKHFRNDLNSKDRFLYSGDLFKQDEKGFLYFVGRKDEMIKSKGERISPKEIENVICELNGVNEAAVIGVTDEILGQAIMAFISCNDGININEKDVLKHCTLNLEPFMVPRHVEFIKEFPITPNGKIDKKVLANLLLNNKVKKI